MKRLTLVSLAAIISTMLIISSARAQQHDAPKVEVSAQFSSLSISDPPGGSGTENAAGFGGRITYNLTDHLAVEVEGNIYPAEMRRQFALGGKAEQMQFGVKAGKRYKRFGLFAKARPGFVSFSRVPTFTGTESFSFGGQTFTLDIFEDRRKTNFSMDVGGVLEFYPTHRIITRFDIGDTLIRFGPSNMRSLQVSGPNFSIPAEITHNFQFSAGIGFRF